MDPSQNYNFYPNYNFPNQAQNPNIRPPNPENPQNTGMHPNVGMPYMMPPNYGMQYPFNQPYMPYGYQPVPGNNCYVPAPPAPTNCPNTEGINEPNTPHYSSGSTEIPDFSTQISLERIGSDKPNSFLPPTQQSTRRSSYDTWSTEENKVLLSGYFHFSVDSELGNNQKGDNFWGKIAEYLNENFAGGKCRSGLQCQSHFRDINRKLGIFVGCYSTACRQKKSGWSDEDYISKGIELYQESQGKRFSLLEEWKLVRHQPRYMLGAATESASSGSKRKSGEDVESSAPGLERPEGRDAAKKKARASSSKPKASRKSKNAIEEELANLATQGQAYDDGLNNHAKAMNEYARVKKLELVVSLGNKENRNAAEEATYQLLMKEMFGN